MVNKAIDIDVLESGRTLDKTAVAVGLVASFLLHIAAYFLTPAEFARFVPTPQSEELKLEILPPKIVKKLPDFVEANPLANTQKPLSADAPESFTDQRAADFIPDPSSKSKMPYVEGEIKNGKKIVSGTSSPDDILNPQQPFETLQRPLEQPAQASEFFKPSQSQSTHEPQKLSTQKTADSSKEVATPAKSENSISKSSREGDSKKSSTEISEGKAHSQAAPKNNDGNPALQASKDASKKSPTDGAKKTSPDDGAAQAPNGSREPIASKTKPSEQTPQPPTDESLPVPKPRPYLSMRIPAGPLADNRARASTQGTVAVDSRFSEFGAYQQRMIEAISRQWNLLGSQYDLNTAINTMVVIEYTLNIKGELTSISVLFSNSTNTGRGLCEQSILTTAPYGEWTKEMISALGDQNQEVRITFHYR